MYTTFQSGKHVAVASAQPLTDNNNTNITPIIKQPAIAAALSLRTYLLVTKNPEDTETINLEFPDIGFSHSWNRADFPWHLTTNEQGVPMPDEELNPELVNEITPLLTTVTSQLHYSAAYTFLYLFISLCPNDIEGGLTFTVRSTLPIGAGLGSSASISVCLASALSYIGGHIKDAIVESDTIIKRDSDDCTFIDAWSFMGEKCIHGNPSGIDNAVATHGGAVMFQRMANSMPSVRTSMRNFPKIDLLLTNTKTPRRTATLVGNVARITNEFPKTSGAILESMEAIAREAYNLMLKPFLDEESKSRLFELVRLNHGLLVSLGVSHPNLERIKLYCDELSIGQTKLTGAGGGGCAITLMYENIVDENLVKLKAKFQEKGFETFETSLGGKGVALLAKPSEELCKKLTVESFINVSSTYEIEETFGCSKVDAWRYW